MIRIRIEKLNIGSFVPIKVTYNPIDTFGEPFFTSITASIGSGDDLINLSTVKVQGKGGQCKIEILGIDLDKDILFHLSFILSMSIS